MRQSKRFAAICLFGLALIWSAPGHAQDDPLRHGHALVIGAAKYTDGRWPPLSDVGLQIRELERALRPHFDDVTVLPNPTFASLDKALREFFRTYGNSGNARLFIYYGGHGYTEVNSDRNEYRGYITGTDTPYVDGTESGFASARLKAISMESIRGIVSDSNARQVLFVFDSCFAGTVFTARAPSSPIARLTEHEVTRIMGLPVREFLTAGDMQETIPAHSPIPQLLIDALAGSADPYNIGVVTGQQISQFLWAHTRGLGISPRDGKLPGGYFDRGEFLFRTIVVAPLTPAYVPLPQTLSQMERGDTAGSAPARPGRPDDLPSFFAQPAGQDLFQIGTATASRGDLAEAARLYRLAANQGNASAQVNLGIYYERGLGGLKKDEREAARLYRLAANQGNARAQSVLANLYRDGRGGLHKDYNEAARLLRLAANQGDAAAQSDLGVMYAEGAGGLPQDDREAARLYRLAADQGESWGELNLGYMYSLGLGGLPKDEREALRLYRLAANQGNPIAQSNLANGYWEGRDGLPKDQQEAIRLWQQSARGGNARAQENLRAVGQTW